MQLLGQKPDSSERWSASVKYNGHSLTSCQGSFSMKSYLSPTGLVSICIVLSFLAAVNSRDLAGTGGVLAAFQGGTCKKLPAGTKHVCELFGGSYMKNRCKQLH